MGVLARKLLSATGGGPIEFVGSKTSIVVGSVSTDTVLAIDSGLTGGIASAVSDGDFVIAAFHVGSEVDHTLSITDGTTDYELIGTELYASDNDDSNLRVAYKFVSGDADVTFGPTNDAADFGCATVRVYRNVDPTTPLDVAAVTATGTNSQIPNPPAITPVTAGAYIVAIGGSASFSATITSSNLTDVTSVFYGPSGDRSLLGTGHKTDWTSGSFDPAMAISVGDDTRIAWTAVTIALRPEFPS